MARIAPVTYDYDGSEETERGQRPSRAIRRRRAWTQPGGSGPSTLVSAIVIANGDIELTYSSTPPSDANFTLAGTPVLVDGTSVAGNVRTLSVDSPILATETVTVSSDTLTTQATTNNSNMALEVAVATLFDASGTFTGHSPHRVVDWLIWPGGGGGDGGSGAGGSGAGGVRVRKTITNAKASYSYVRGAGGLAGTGSTSGTATAGGDSILSDDTGEIARAKGQPPGVGGAVTGTGGVSTVTGSTGDSVLLGGNGAGTNGVNIGGASAGLTSAAVTTTPGAPNGVRGLGSAAAPRANGGGTTAGPNATGLDGGTGYFEVYYQRAVARVRPRCIGIRNDRRITNGTSTVVVLADGSAASDVRAPAVGDVAATYLAIDGNTGTSPAGTGWRKVGTDVGTVTVPMLFTRNVTGGDPVTFTHASEISNWFTFIYEDVSDEADVTATSASVAANNPDPGSHDHGAVVDGLWVSMLAADQGGSTPLRIDAFPASTDNQLRTTFSAAAGAVNLAICHRELLATQVHDFSAWGTSGQAANGGVITACFPLA
jgi:hypothetical protein